MDWFSVAIQQATTHRRPFLHTQLNSIFTEQLLHDMLRFFPNEQDMFLVDKGTRDQGVRHHIFLNERLEQQIATPESATFWFLFWQSVVCEAHHIKQSAIQYFQQWQLFPGIAETDIKLGVRLVNESLPYSMAPHIDQAFKLAVLVVFLDTDEPTSSQGTQLFNKQPDGTFRSVSRLPFECNSGVFMPRVRGSWHGGAWHGSGHRKTLHLYFFKASGVGEPNHPHPIYV